MYARGHPGTFISATTIPTDTDSDIVLNISSQNCEDLSFLPVATVLIGGCRIHGAESGSRSIDCVNFNKNSSIERPVMRCVVILIPFFEVGSHESAATCYVTFSQAISRARSCLMRAKPNLELRKRGSISWARKYNDCCAFASICKGGSHSDPLSHA